MNVSIVDALSVKCGTSYIVFLMSQNNSRVCAQFKKKKINYVNFNGEISIIY